MPGDPGEGGSTGGTGGGGGGGTGGGSEAVGTGPGGDGPAIGEGFNWRRRAIAAEQKLEQAQARFQEQLKDLEAQLVAARAGLGEAERRRAIDAELMAAGVLDLETARLLTESAVPGDAEPADAVAELRRRKPFLFRSAPAASAMSAITEPGRAGADLAGAARESGDRRALLRYLRSKRSM
ncbi:MAG: hypothetical protein IT436_02315 [Phycisphaerales bacterium]|nr:hypothetical protein [Phycisphaerales bacterium]